MAAEVSMQLSRMHRVDRSKGYLRMHERTLHPTDRYEHESVPEFFIQAGVHDEHVLWRGCSVSSWFMFTVSLIRCQIGSGVVAVPVIDSIH